MVRLTVEQNRIGQILQAGSLLLNDSSTADSVGRQIEAQMSLLNKHWEQLRIQAMDRQTRYCVQLLREITQDGPETMPLCKVYSALILHCPKNGDHIKQYNTFP